MHGNGESEGDQRHLMLKFSRCEVVHRKVCLEKSISIRPSIFVYPAEAPSMKRREVFIICPCTLAGFTNLLPCTHLGNIVL